MKIVYHIGSSIGKETIVKKGVIEETSHPIIIKTSDGEIVLDNLKDATLSKINGFGTCIKIINNCDTIFLVVPRIFFDIGTGFIVANYFATIKLKQILASTIK